MSTEKPPKPAATSDWDLHSRQDKELVKGLGLTSATMLVMGSMIGSGIFIVSAEISREVNSPALADRSLAGHRLPHHCGRPQLWRTGGHDAAGWWPICLSARSAGSALGISLRLDALPGDSDRNDCRRRSRVRQVSRHFLSLDFFYELDRALLESAAHPYWPDGPGKHGNRAEHAESGGHPGSGGAFGHQYLRLEDRGADSERVYGRQGFRACWGWLFWGC